MGVGAKLTLTAAQALGVCRRNRHRLKAGEEGIRGRTDFRHRYDL